MARIGLAWADDGKTITWAVGASYFRQPLSSVSFEPPKDEKKDGEDKDKKDADKKDSDKKESADAKSDAKSDDKKDGDKKDAKKEEKKFKEQEKDVTEIAVDLEVPRKTPKGTVVLRGATVVTMNGDEVLKNADIVVEDNRIKRVGAKGSVPSGAKVIDVRGQDDCAGICRYTCALDGDSARNSGYAELGVSRESGVWRDRGTRCADQHERYVCVPGSGR